MNNKKIILICEECLSRNYSFHASSKRVEKMEMNKHCKHCNKHTKHIETR